MRELKFRAWDSYHKEFIFDAQATYDNQCRGKGSIHHESFQEVLEDEGCIVEQFTGLKDKNGKEIYEGDIVEQFVCGVRQFKGMKCGRSTIWLVRWNEKECCFELHYLNGSLFGDSMLSDGDEYEVIGNIHENPELVKEEE
jgi:uncharacterized phage protein (TIGR01671 family)